MVAMASKQNFEHCRKWSQLKAQQSLLLNSTISMPSWNYIYLELDGFEVVTWCVGWCVKKNESPKVCFCSVDKIPIFSYIVATSCVAKWYQWLGIWLSRNIRFVGVSVGMSARDRHFQTNYWCIISYHQISSSLEAAWCYGAKIIVSL